jgi:hypothetical protein
MYKSQWKMLPLGPTLPVHALLKTRVYGYVSIDYSINFLPSTRPERRCYYMHLQSVNKQNVARIAPASEASDSIDSMIRYFELPGLPVKSAALGVCTVQTAVRRFYGIDYHKTTPELCHFLSACHPRPLFSSVLRQHSQQGPYTG